MSNVIAKTENGYLYSILKMTWDVIPYEITFGEDIKRAYVFDLDDEIDSRKINYIISQFEDVHFLPLNEEQDNQTHPDYTTDRDAQDIKDYDEMIEQNTEEELENMIEQNNINDELNNLLITLNNEIKKSSENLSVAKPKDSYVGRLNTLKGQINGILNYEEQEQEDEEEDYTLQLGKITVKRAYVPHIVAINLENEFNGKRDYNLWFMNGMSIYVEAVSDEEYKELMKIWRGEDNE